MREFVFGSDQQYRWLENLINDGRCHVFNNCTLPDSCTPSHCRLGFEKADAVYVAYIDRGISTTSGKQSFAHFLQNGEAKFTCMEDMMEFFRSLKSLFDATNIQAPSSAVSPNRSGAEVVDMDALVAERQQKTERQMIDPAAISTPLKQKVFGQGEAIDSLAELIALNRMRKTDKLLVAMLLGPCATGKSETAKSVAEVLSDVTGTKYGFIELAGS